MSGSLDRRRFIFLSTLAAANAAVPRTMAEAVAETAPSHWDGYDKAILIDALGGPGGGGDGPLTAAQLADIRSSGLTAVNLTVGALGSGADVFEATFKTIGGWEREIDAHPDVLMKVKSAADLERAKESRRLGLIYGFQDATPLGDDPGRVELFSRFGVRIIQLTYNRRNLLGDGCLEPANAGLSRLGQQVVERMNELGVLVDLSHCGHRTTLDGIAMSKRPVAITHAGCAAVADLPRNKTDEELRRLADKGGVMGIYFMPFLRAKGQPMAADLIRHIEHAVNVAGEDHVGLGTDGGISGIELTPEFIKRHREDVQNRRRLGISAPGEEEDVYTFLPDLNTPRRFETLAAMLRERGHSQARIGKILGGNFARLFREVWQTA
ncbi:MAG TPA: membrane dipeptidase [Thermoanaerobaculia bacterium]|nr:membrane dipeptidase [Thermoanaerobaculia bacterium]